MYLETSLFQCCCTNSTLTGYMEMHMAKSISPYLNYDRTVTSVGWKQGCIDLSMYSVSMAMY